MIDQQLIDDIEKDIQQALKNVSRNSASFGSILRRMRDACIKNGHDSSVFESFDPRFTHAFQVAVCADLIMREFIRDRLPVPFLQFIADNLDHYLAEYKMEPNHGLKKEDDDDWPDDLTVH